jgi:hypothetical protein
MTTGYLGPYINPAGTVCGLYHARLGRWLDCSFELRAERTTLIIPEVVFDLVFRHVENVGWSLVHIINYKGG